MRHPRPLLVALCATASPFLFGQISSSLPSISGAFVDPTGAVIAGATVSVVEERTGRNQTGQTDNVGHYEFSRLPSGHYILKVTSAGFQTFVASDAQVTAAQPVRINARLSIGSASSTVQVSAAERLYAALESNAGTRTPTPLIEVPQSIEVLDRTLIQDQDRRTLADALVNVSGVTPTKPEEILFTQLLVRGFPADIYTNGLSMFGNTTTANDPTSLVGTEQIDVVKGPNSTMYGGGLGSPLGGLIHVVSVRPGPTLGGYVGLRGGNFGTFDHLRRHQCLAQLQDRRASFWRVPEER